MVVYKSSRRKSNGSGQGWLFRRAASCTTLLLLFATLFSFFKAATVSVPSSATTTASHLSFLPPPTPKKGGAWTAQTHLKNYGFNVDWGLMEVLESSCREIENSRIPPGSSDIGWKRYKNPDPFNPLIDWWMAPEKKKFVNCKVLEVGCGVGVYVDALKKERTKRNRIVIGIEPNPMQGAFERGKNGPKQLAVDILAGGDTKSVTDLAKRISNEELKGGKFDLIYSIEVFEHMPHDRHDDAVRFLKALSRKGTKLIFGAGKPAQEGVGHIGLRSHNEWIDIMAKHGFVANATETADAVHRMQEYNHRQNTVVYYYRGD